MAQTVSRPRRELGAEADAAAQQAADLCRQLSEATPGTNIAHLAESLADVARTLADLGLGDEVVTAVERATAAHLDVGDDRRAAELLMEFGNAVAELRRLETAATFHERAAALFAKVGDRSLEAAALLNLSRALLELGQHSAMIAALSRAATVYNGINDHDGVGKALLSLSNVPMSTGRFDQATSVGMRAAALLGRDREGEVLYHLICKLVETAQTAQGLRVARRWLTVCRESGDRSGEGTALLILGGVLVDEGQYQEAVVVNKQAVDFYREHDNSEALRIALRHLRMALRALGRADG